MFKRNLFLTGLLLFFSVCFSQTGIRYVHLSDTHIGNASGADDLRRTVNDINASTDIQFVIITGDITEFGTDEEIRLAKQILDSLNKPWHIIPGNHDSNWSESGSNTFKRVFGKETFAFNAGGFLFLGTHSGPNMRMSPGQIPRENIVWLDSVLKATDDATPIIFANHYPLDSGLNNWFEAIDRLKTKNIQMLMCGHGHTNQKMELEGIPSIMGRSNLRASKPVGGYNIVAIKNNVVTYQERNPGVGTQPVWATVELKNLNFRTSSVQYRRPDYSVNKIYSQVKVKWTFQDDSDIGSGTSADAKHVYVTNTAGEVIALKKKNGKRDWTFQTNGKIYSIPAVSSNVVVAASSDNYIYGISANKGKQLWKVKADKAVLGNPVIHDGVAYIGASDGHFRAINIKDGSLRWSFDEVKGFVVTRPLIYNNKIYFGCWGRELYCLDLATGKLVWSWNNGHGSRNFSPAAVFPVAAGNRIFIVAPDRYMTCLDANTGAVIWRKQDPAMRVRESIGISGDSSLIYVKTMEGNVFAMSATANDMTPVWKSDVELGYEISPTAIVENNGIVFVPTQSGLTAALDRLTGKYIWKHKTSNGLVTNLQPLNKNQLLVTTMDGKVSLLEF